MLLPSEKHDLEKELDRLIGISEHERLLTREEQDKLNQIIKILSEIDD